MEDPRTATDEELLSRICRRDEAALCALFSRYFSHAVAIATRILRDHGEAEDVVQEVFIRMFCRPNGFDAELGSARSWIIHIVYRRALDRRSYLARRHFYCRTNRESPPATRAEGIAAEKPMMDRLTTEGLRPALSQLTEKQRLTMELHFFQGLTFKEISERIGDGIPNVRHYYYRGLESLRRIVTREPSPVIGRR
jgi:RNA polymerase sigma-70 factor (ECF subfamily)